MWRTDEGRFRMTPACLSPAPSVVCSLEPVCFKNKPCTEAVIRSFGLKRCSQCSTPSLIFPSLSVDCCKHVVFSVFQSTFDPFYGTKAKHPNGDRNASNPLCLSNFKMKSASKIHKSEFPLSSPLYQRVSQCQSSLYVF